MEEGVLTDTQRQSQFVQLMALKQIGVPIPDDLIIKNSNLHGKQALEEHLAQAAQAAQQQAQAAEQLQMKIIDSKAQADTALAAERMNKIQLDAALSAERISRAEEDRTAGVLNLIKAAKELEGIDLDHFMKAVEIAKAMTEEQKTKETQQVQNG